MAEEQNPEKISMAPKPESGNKKLALILVTCAILAAGAFWLLREPIKTALNKPAPTPVNSQMRLQLPGPPPMAESNATNSSADMLAMGNATMTNGTAVRTDSPAGVSPGANKAGSKASSASQNVGRIMPRVEDDSIIRISFIEDLARYLAESYYPAHSGPAKGDNGVLVNGAKSLNMNYGVKMTGLVWSGDDIQKGHQSVLRYALTPTMTDALYRLYVDRFMHELQKQAKLLVRNVEGEDRPLTRMEIKEMHHLLSQKVMATAGILRACSLMEDAMPRIEMLHTATRDALKANQAFQITLLQYQELSEAAKDTKAIAKARAGMDASGKAYQQAIIQRERSRESLANALRKYKWAPLQDDNTNVYIAQWVYRRVEDNPKVFPALMTLHEKLLDLADRLDKKAAL